MGGGHEIVSLHLGNYANYVAAHYWNLQDEVLGHGPGTSWGHVIDCVDQSPLFVETLDSRGQPSWKPRALFMDLSGALGGVSTSTAAPSSVAPLDTVSTWSGGMAVHAATRVPKSEWVTQLEQHAEYEDDDTTDEAIWEERQRALERAAAALSGGDTGPSTGPGAASVASAVGRSGQGVRYWTDYLKVVLPSQCMFTLPGAWHGTTEFQGWGDGRSVMSQDVWETLSERVRRLVEACDGLQGVQVTADDQGGWGSIAKRLLEEVSAEYCVGGRPCVVFSVRPPVLGTDTPYQNVRRSLNEALTLQSVRDCSHLYCPLQLPTQPPPGPGGLSHLRWSPGSHFTTAAVLASTLDTALLPTRLTSHTTSLGAATGSVNLHSLQQLLTGCQRGSPLVALAAALPLATVTPPSHQAQAQADVRAHPTPAQATATANGHPNLGSGAPSRGAEPAPAATTSASTATSATTSGADTARETFTSLSELTSLTPGVVLGTDVLAQSLCMRGASTSSGPASCSTMQAALDTVIQSARYRCVTHRSATPLPLLVPLPFPRTLWAPNVGPAGLVMAGRQHSQQPAAGAAGGDVSSAPVLSQLYATGLLEGYIDKVRTEWQRCATSTSGRAMLDQWDIEHSDADAVAESLHELAGLYHDSDDDDGL